MCEQDYSGQISCQNRAVSNDPMSKDWCQRQSDYCTYSDECREPIMTTKVIRLKRWKVEVLPDVGTEKPINYTVIAADALDARIIAFCLAGGFSPFLPVMEQGHVELVKMYTKVLEVSSA